jgi:hypothetical protein
LATLVTSQCLHRRVIHDLGGLPECGFVVKADPAVTEIDGFGEDPSAVDRAGDPDRDAVPRPIVCKFLRGLDHLRCGQGRPRVGTPRLLLPAGEHFDVRSPDVDDEDRAHGEASELARAETLLRRGALLLPLLLQ